MEDAAHNQMVSLIWNIADDVLREVFLRGRDRAIEVKRRQIVIDEVVTGKIPCA
ncbi:MAG: hypothetical protein IKR48_03850 [Kiritimatiellae bacterium]|nr:hypothetical protein [Kiritimatiellia bacterium]